MDELTLEKLYQVRKAKDKQLIRKYEKRLTTEPVSAQELFVNNNISQRKDDVKCLLVQVLL